MRSNIIPSSIGQRALLAALVVAFAGCASSTSSDTGGKTKDAGSTVDSGTGDDQPGDDSGTTTGDDTGSTATTVALPFNLSDEFIPSGFMGDSQPSMDGIKLSNDVADCKTPRSTGAQGDCYSVTWTATVAAGASAWAGVYWQSPANNWGAKPGKVIAAGATKVSFYAAGAAGGEKIQFCAGGINTKGTDPTLTHRDTFSANLPAVTLTKDWAQYTIPLTGATYGEVLGGFCWVDAATASGTSTFYIDDVRWEQ